MSRNVADTPGSGKATLNRSLERGLEILRAFRAGTEYLGNGDISERTGLSKSTVSRLTQTLIHSGMLVYDGQRSAYRLAPAALCFGHAMYNSSSLLQIAAPLMKEAASELKVNVGLAAADRDEMIYLESIRLSRKHTPRTVLSGQRVPMEFTSLGRAYLATLSEEKRQPLMDVFKSRRCESRWFTLESEILSGIESVRQVGFCAASWQAEVVAISTPLNIHTCNDHVLNISLSTPDRIEDVVRLYSDNLLKLADKIRTASISAIEL
ncbi:IclR family transcriptional regulator [Pseudomonas brassicacearum]|uniref:IclR family transcriptional regulator n=1 Tax=Pseudomonas brassicacearum subsp. neoaurantiaca TaxID=494916 RepID=A0A7V8RHX7_9PSED|nr:IclR family transcriptional regulator [Pseudomonas brassicacearum]MBA1376814.1 IclR family transcriptional regulator [Pseudomonas brassicacearum subsp. neoaurantiaca]